MADDESRKRFRQKKSHYVANNKKRRIDNNLAVGMSGVLITSNEKRERFTIREAYSILNEYADKMYGKEKLTSEKSRTSESEKEEEEEEEDIEKTIAREKEEMKLSFQRFQSVKCGAKNVQFIKTSLPNNEDPTKLVHTILSDILENEHNKSRNCLRFLPVSVSCYASIKEIESAAEELFKSSLLSPDCKPSKFCVVYKARNNDSIHRDDVIAALAKIVRESDMGHTVDLNYPDLTICVEIVRNICCLSVVKDFHKLKKYNIQEIQNACKNNGGQVECAGQTNNNQQSTGESVSDEKLNDGLDSEVVIQNTNTETLDEKCGVKKLSSHDQSNEEKNEADEPRVGEQNSSIETATEKSDTK